MVNIPPDLAFKNAPEVEICREGDLLILRPLKPDWLSLAAFKTVDASYPLKLTEFWGHDL